MMQAENAVVFIDEAQMWFNSREFKTMEVGDMAVFQQSRKNGLDMFWIAQHEARVDTVLRELTSYYYKCKPAFGSYVSVRKVVPDEPDKVVERVVFKKRKYLFDQYWTSEVIGRRDGTGYRFGSLLKGGMTRLDKGRLMPTHVKFVMGLKPDGSYIRTELVPLDKADQRFISILQGFEPGSVWFVDIAIIEGREYVTSEVQPIEKIDIIQKIQGARIAGLV